MKLKKILWLAGALMLGTTFDAVADEPTHVADDRLFERIWKLKNGWKATFLKDGTMSVEEGNPPPRKWHWWTVGNHTFHIQFAADPATFDANIGGTWKFNSSYTKFETVPGKSNARPQTGVALREKIKPAEK